MIESAKQGPARDGRAPQRRALVTGAGGFIGANLVRRLLADGHHVAAVVRPGSEEWRLAALRGQVELCEVELRDEEAARSLVDESRPDWIFHLAAHNYWDRELRPHVETNLIATSTLLRAGAKTGCEAFVHA